MRIYCKIGEIVACVEDDNTYTPEVVADILGRTASAALVIFDKLPEATVVEVGDDDD